MSSDKAGPAWVEHGSILSPLWRYVSCAVRSQASSGDNYRRFRPRTRFFPLFVSDRSADEAMLHVNDNSLVASADRAFTEREARSTSRQTLARTVTLTDLLAKTEPPRIDFLSIDVELTKPRVLNAFDIDRFRPVLVCIEAHSKVRQQVLEYFADHQYTVVGKYLSVGQDNLYFIPRRGARAGAAGLQ